MQWFTFNKVYIALLAIALVSVLILPKRLSKQAQGQFQIVFAPLTWPIRQSAESLRRRLEPEAADPESQGGTSRSYRQIAGENRELHLQIANLTAQIQRLQAINADREALGALRPLCRPMRVVGSDSGLRHSLSLQGDIQSLRAGMAVVYAGGLAGRLDRVGWGGGAQAQLVTDRTFRMTGRFGRLIPGGHGFQELGSFTTLLEGDGKGALIARTVETRLVRDTGLALGDWAVVADNDYPPVLQGYRIGIVTGITPSRYTPQYTEITVKPQVNLLFLPEVMVLVGK